MSEVEWEYPSLADYQREWIADQHRSRRVRAAGQPAQAFAADAVHRAGRPAGRS